ncbi:sigma-70 family RNA polymerase sigma factor [Actinoplanes sp. CA-030573]|uniref:sigma-70 family RNA polymerase sigma factor n=1 Tax=Actinoplanes sp. CA-030573 TaxID=3239898 RepID=UPI003D8BEDE8
MTEDLDQAADLYLAALADAGERRRERLRDEFVGRCLPLAGRLARRFGGRGEPAEDLEQVARLGLVKAVNRFDPERGSFTAYAIITITGEIKRHFRNHGWGMHVTRRLQNLMLEVGQATRDLTAELSRRPTDDEVAARMAIDVEDVRDARSVSAAYSPGSLNAPAEGYESREVGDLLGELDADLGHIDDRLTVERLICHLPARERRMLALRFYGNRSQTEIADELGISQMHVSRQLSRALAWLRDAMLGDDIPPWPGVDHTEHRFTIGTSWHGNDIRLRVRGEVDRDNAGILRDELVAVVRAGQRLVVDLSGVPLLDAAGIGVPVAVHEAARVRGAEVRVTGLQPYASQIAAATGLRDLLGQ